MSPYRAHRPYTIARTFRLTRRWRVGLYAGIAVCVVMATGVFLAARGYFSDHGRDGGVGLYVATAVFLGFAGMGCLALRQWVEIRGDGTIRVPRTFGTSEHHVREFRGFAPVWHGSTVIAYDLYDATGTTRAQISASLEDVHVVEAWLRASFRQRDAEEDVEEQTGALDAVAAPAAGGDERTESAAVDADAPASFDVPDVAAARRAAKPVAVAGLVVGGAIVLHLPARAWFLTGAFTVATAATLVAAYAVAHRHRSAIWLLDEGSNEGDRPSMFDMVFVPSLGLGLVGLVGPPVLDFVRLGVATVAFAATLWLPLWRIPRHARTEAYAAAGLTAAIALAAGYGVAHALDTKCDPRPPSVCAGHVAGVTRDGSIVRLTRCAAVATPRDVTVPARMLPAARVGATVRVEVGGGALGVPWVRAVAPADAPRPAR